MAYGEAEGQNQIYERLTAWQQDVFSTAILETDKFLILLFVFGNNVNKSRYLW